MYLGKTSLRVYLTLWYQPKWTDQIPILSFLFSNVCVHLWLEGLQCRLHYNNQHWTQNWGPDWTIWSSLYAVTITYFSPIELHCRYCQLKQNSKQTPRGYILNKFKNNSWTLIDYTNCTTKMFTCWSCSRGVVVAGSGHVFMHTHITMHVTSHTLSLTCSFRPTFSHRMLIPCEGLAVLWDQLKGS